MPKAGPKSDQEASPKTWRSFTNSYKVAPAITGIAKKKENSVATVLGKPNNMPPMMVAPDLEVPGIKAAH